MFLPIVLIVIGLVILIGGAEFLVRGASSIAKRAGISELTIGLTVVAFGTSMPELVVNMIAAFKGTADIAVGNIVGSNIANILLILGISAIIYPLAVKSNTVWKEIPFAVLAMVLVFVMGNDAFLDGVSFNAITRTDGLVLLAMFAIFMYYIFGSAKTEGEGEDVKIYTWSISLIFTAIGLVALFYGGKLLVDNAVIVARVAGLSEALIGLTVVAVGTSLPELATSAVAAYRHKNDIAVGNIVGSNIFNVFWILGLTGTIMQMPFNPAANIDALVALLAAVLLFVFMFVHTRHKINRWQGVMFVLLYVVYTGYLIMRG